jgi:hypothetical protein
MVRLHYKEKPAYVIQYVLCVCVCKYNMYETEENPDISSGYRGLILNLEWLPVGNVYINVRLIL